MASVIPRPGGHHWIQLRVGPARHTIRLGRCSRKDAESTRTRVEALAVALELGTDPDVETAVWLARCGDVLHHRLTAAGLTHGRSRVRDVTLGVFADAFLDEYTAGGDASKLTIQVALQRVRSHFGDDRIMRRVTEADAAAFRLAMESHDYAQATIATTVKKVRQLWSEALKRKMVNSNVWLGVRAGDQSNDTRFFAVTPEMTERLIAACRTDEWKLSIALCRYGGLRFPSEHRRLTRADVDIERSRFLVRGKRKDRVIRERWVPIFPELRPHLERRLSTVNADPETRIVTHDDVEGGSLRNQFRPILARAGLTAWPRLFHNFRASRQTELVAMGYSEHVVAYWLGNSKAIGRQHYLHPTEVDFERAVTAGKPG